MRKTKLIIGVLIGLLLLAVVAVAALYFVDPSVFRGQLEARASELLGRQFQIDGPIRLERSMRPRIIIEDIAADRLHAHAVWHHLRPTWEWRRRLHPNQSLY